MYRRPLVEEPFYGKVILIKTAPLNERGNRGENVQRYTNNEHGEGATRQIMCITDLFVLEQPGRRSYFVPPNIVSSLLQPWVRVETVPDNKPECDQGHYTRHSESISTATVTFHIPYSRVCPLHALPPPLRPLISSPRIYTCGLRRNITKGQSDDKRQELTWGESVSGELP